MHRYDPRTCVVTKNGGTPRAGPHTPLSNAINMITRSLGALEVATGVETTVENLTCINTPLPGDTFTAAPPASEENTLCVTDTTTVASSPFFKLPGELRNRIYHLYFEGFEEQMSLRFAYSKSKMSPNFFALMHTNRVIRSEAGSVFYKEIASFHSFTCPIDQPIEAVMLTRIRDVCSLVSIFDAHMCISVRCTPSWKDHHDFRNFPRDTWRSREVRAFANRAWLQVSCTARPPKLTTEESSQWLHGVHSSWSSCALDHTNEARTTTGFLVKYRDDGKRADENFVHVEGQLAQVTWNRGWHF